MPTHEGSDIKVCIDGKEIGRVQSINALVQYEHPPAYKQSFDDGMVFIVDYMKSSSGSVKMDSMDWNKFMRDALLTSDFLKPKDDNEHHSKKLREW